MSLEPVGIMSTGIYLPKQRLSGKEIALRSGLPVHVVEDKLGIIEKTVPGEEDHTAQMGVWAAQEALKKAALDPKEVDLLIYIGEEHKEYPLWTAGIYIQKEIGAVNAWAFDIALRCGTTVMAMKVAKDLMRTNPEIKTALLAGGYRNSDFIDFTNPRTRFMYNLASGGGAIILRKGLQENVLLETTIVTDGSFSEDVVVPVGGTKQPVNSQWLQKNSMQLDVLDPDGMKQRLEQKSMANFLFVIEDSLKKSGYGKTELDYLAVLHMKRSAHDYILKELQLNDEQSYYLNHFGHIGQFDQILSIELASKQGKITDGSVISMVSAGIGYAWAANTICWGKAT
jgi:3-oxoacyl-[acyl-carrier-protein] synthase-3